MYRRPASGAAGRLNSPLGHEVVYVRAWRAWECCVKGQCARPPTQLILTFQPSRDTRRRMFTMRCIDVPRAGPRCVRIRCCGVSLRGSLCLCAESPGVLRERSVRARPLTQLMLTSCHINRRRLCRDTTYRRPASGAAGPLNSLCVGARLFMFMCGEPGSAASKVSVHAPSYTACADLDIRRRQCRETTYRRPASEVHRASGTRLDGDVLEGCKRSVFVLVSCPAFADAWTAQTRLSCFSRTWMPCETPSTARDDISTSRERQPGVLVSPRLLMVSSQGAICALGMSGAYMLRDDISASRERAVARLRNSEWAQFVSVNVGRVYAARRQCRMGSCRRLDATFESRERRLGGPLWLVAECELVRCESRSRSALAGDKHGCNSRKKYKGECTNEST